LVPYCGYSRNEKPGYNHGKSRLFAFLKCDELWGCDFKKKNFHVERGVTRDSPSRKSLGWSIEKTQDYVEELPKAFIEPALKALRIAQEKKSCFEGEITNAVIESLASDGIRTTRVGNSWKHLRRISMVFLLFFTLYWLYGCALDQLSQFKEAHRIHSVATYNLNSTTPLTLAPIGTIVLPFNNSECKVTVNTQCGPALSEYSDIGVDAKKMFLIYLYNMSKGTYFSGFNCSSSVQVSLPRSKCQNQSLAVVHIIEDFPSVKAFEMYFCVSTVISIIMAIRDQMRKWKEEDEYAGTDQQRIERKNRPTWKKYFERMVEFFYYWAFLIILWPFIAAFYLVTIIIYFFLGVLSGKILFQHYKNAIVRDCAAHAETERFEKERDHERTDENCDQLKIELVRVQREVQSSMQEIRSSINDSGAEVAHIPVAVSEQSEEDEVSNSRLIREPIDLTPNSSASIGQPLKRTVALEGTSKRQKISE
jgi:hypothetical protein